MQHKALTVADYIKKYLELRDTIADKTRAYEESIKDDKENMQLLEGLLTAEINRVGGQNIKTQFGTAYRHPMTSVRVFDRDMWVGWIMKEDHPEMLTLNVAKAAVTEYIERTKETPPGIDVTKIWQTHVRKPD